MNACFDEKITVIDEWKDGNESFRLVDLGAGPKELQVEQLGTWMPEQSQYIHGVLCSRIEMLSND